MAAHDLADVIETDLRFLEIVMPDHDGEGQVVFSTKELLVDIRGAIAELGRTNKADLDAVERRITETTGRLETRISNLERDNVANKVQWGKVAGIAALAGVTFGATVAALATAIIH